MRGWRANPSTPRSRSVIPPALPRLGNMRSRFSGAGMRMVRKARIAPWVVGAVMLALAVSAQAEGPEAPELLALELVEHGRAAPKGSEVALSILSEAHPPDRVLAARLKAGGFLPNFLAGMSWSPDGSEIAFAAEAKAETASSRAIYTVKADGSDLRRLPGTRGGANPVFAPTGRLSPSRVRSCGFRSSTRRSSRRYAGPGTRAPPPGCSTSRPAKRVASPFGETASTSSPAPSLPTARRSR